MRVQGVDGKRREREDLISNEARDGIPTRSPARLTSSKDSLNTIHQRLFRTRNEQIHLILLGPSDQPIKPLSPLLPTTTTPLDIHIPHFPTHIRCPTIPWRNVDLGDTFGLSEFVGESVFSTSGAKEEDGEVGPWGGERGDRRVGHGEEGLDRDVWERECV